MNGKTLLAEAIEMKDEIVENRSGTYAFTTFFAPTRLTM